VNRMKVFVQEFIRVHESMKKVLPSIDDKPVKDEQVHI